MDIAARVISVVGRTSTSDPSTASSSNPPKVGRVMDVSDGVFIGGFIPCKNSRSFAIFSI